MTAPTAPPASRLAELDAQLDVVRRDLDEARKAVAAARAASLATPGDRELRDALGLAVAVYRQLHRRALGAADSYAAEWWQRERAG